MDVIPAIDLLEGRVAPEALAGKIVLFGTSAVGLHDLNATLLHLLGFDHEKLTFRFQGRDYRLTDVHGEVVQKLLA